MTEGQVVILTAVVAVAAAVVGYALANFVASKRRQREKEVAEETIGQARLEAQRILARAEEEGRARAEAYRERESANLEQRRLEVGALESRLNQREATLEQRAANLANRERMLLQREEELAEARAAAEKMRESARADLERLAGLDSRAAKEELLAQVEEEARREAMILVRDLEIKAREEADKRARRILATAIQRLAAEVVTETTVSTVSLPSDDMKGRIIGREGRNIRHLEQITGVNLIVDDTPEAVSVSSFDPVRREVARSPWKADRRRAHPPRVHRGGVREGPGRGRTERARRRRMGAPRGRSHPDAPGVGDTPRAAQVPDLLRPERAQPPGGVGPPCFDARHRARCRPRPRPSCGPAPRHRQGRDPRGRGITRSHRRRDRPAVRGGPGGGHGIEAHHNEVEPRTILAVLVQAADAISAARPGARRETLESYVRRLERLESLAREFEGVERVFALQAGREVRVMVDPGEVTDLEANDLARRIARKLEEDLSYPGTIQVTVIREFRATDFAR